MAYRKEYKEYKILEIMSMNKLYLDSTEKNIYSIKVCNGTVGKLVHLDFDEHNIVCRAWLEFCGSDKIGRKRRTKTGHLRVQNVPIDLRTEFH